MPKDVAVSSLKTFAKQQGLRILLPPNACYGVGCMVKQHRNNTSRGTPLDVLLPGADFPLLKVTLSTPQNMSFVAPADVTGAAASWLNAVGVMHGEVDAETDISFELTDEIQCNAPAAVLLRHFNSYFAELRDQLQAHFEDAKAVFLVDRCRAASAIAVKRAATRDAAYEVEVRRRRSRAAGQNALEPQVYLWTGFKITLTAHGVEPVAPDPSARATQRGNSDDLVRVDDLDMADVTDQ